MNLCCVCRLIKPLRSAPLRAVPLRSAPLRSAPLYAPLRSVPLRSASLCSAPLRSHTIRERIWWYVRVGAVGWSVFEHCAAVLSPPSGGTIVHSPILPAHLAPYHDIRYSRILFDVLCTHQSDGSGCGGLIGRVVWTVGWFPPVVPHPVVVWEVVVNTDCEMWSHRNGFPGA